MCLRFFLTDFFQANPFLIRITPCHCGWACRCTECFLSNHLVSYRRKRQPLESWRHCALTQQEKMLLVVQQVVAVDGNKAQTHAPTCG